ncbi:MAG: hypothetical protein KDA91_19505, partial [Planctomycetaceae bacterium]|nr:hypothetical protein [Planctomycetaceae bacterium]
MRPSRKLAHGSLAVLLLTSGAGCAGSRLANMFSMTPKSDYKTIEELEMEAERQEAERQALLADGTVEEPEQPVKEGPLSGLLARMTGKGPVESDPFLELENQTVDENRIAEEKHLAELEKKLEQERTALQELKKSRVAEADDALTDEFNKLVADSKDASDDFEELAAQFAASEASEASDPNADLPRGDDSFAAFINADAENKFGSQIRTDRVQPDLNEDTFASIETQTRQNVEETEASAAFGETSANPADALQAFLARNGHPVDSEPSTRLVSASKPSSSRAGDEFDAFAGLVQDRPDTAKPAINSHAGTQTADSKHSAFDSLLADATPRTSGDSSFDLNANMGESNIESDPFGFDPSFIESPRKPVVADSMQQNSAKANDLFASVDQTAAKPLTDATGFEWKQDPKTEEETNWWSNGDSQPAQMNLNAPSRSSFPV